MQFAAYFLEDGVFIFIKNAILNHTYKKHLNIIIQFILLETICNELSIVVKKYYFLNKMLSTNDDYNLILKTKKLNINAKSFWKLNLTIIYGNIFVIHSKNTINRSL